MFAGNRNNADKAGVEEVRDREGAISATSNVS